MPQEITPTILLLSSTIALLALWNARIVAREKATIDLIEKVESTPHYRALNNRFSELRRSGDFLHLVDPVPDDHAPDRAALIDYLNHYELIALGINRRILDERFYYRWMRGAFVRDWNAAAAWIQRERWQQHGRRWKYHGRTYAQYQRVACRWSRQARRLSRFSGGRPR